MDIFALGVSALLAILIMLGPVWKKYQARKREKRILSRAKDPHDMLNR